MFPSVTKSIILARKVKERQYRGNMALPSAVNSLIDLALEEDLGKGDLASFSVDSDLEIKAKVITREDIIVSGMDIAKAIIEKVNIAPQKLQICVEDGKPAPKQTNLLTIEGNARKILGIERTLLNFLQRACSIATIAAQYKKKIPNSNIKILDTRKTIPGWRYLDKKSVRDGGLWNHRYNLGTQTLIKENHIVAAGGIKNIIQKLRDNDHSEKLEDVQIEVANLEQAKEALNLGFTQLLLDNFSPEKLKVIAREVRKINKDVLLEASGKITLENINKYAETGIDRISIGALTHSVKAVDLSMLLDK